jgi:hypothetical protein
MGEVGSGAARRLESVQRREGVLVGFRWRARRTSRTARSRRGDKRADRDDAADGHPNRYQPP